MSEANAGAHAGRMILVTGASSGLGAAMVRHLAAQGAGVAAAARRRDALDALAAEAPGRIHPVALDVADAGSVGRAVEEAAERLGGLDGLVANAGIAWGGRALDMEDEDWDRIIEVNLSGVFRTARAAARVMARGDGGAIVTVSSILGLGTGAGVAAYSASKAGVAHLTRSLAVEWARHGIRVNALAPGYIPTDINRAHLEGPAGEELKRAIPMRRLGTEADLMAPLDLLLGPGGAYVTGTVLPVDGGHLIRPL